MQVKDFQVSLLMDMYRPMLTKKQYDVLDMYYNLDYSLSEIAENEEISRQGVLDLIKRSVQKLYEYEEKLGLMKKYSVTEQAIKKIEKLIIGLNSEDEISKALLDIRSAWEE